LQKERKWNERTNRGHQRNRQKLSIGYLVDLLGSLMEEKREEELGQFLVFEGEEGREGGEEEEIDSL